MAGITSQVLTAVRNRLKQENFSFSEEWFDACIDWIRTETSPSQQMTIDIVHREVEDQWKDSNLELIGAKCLPPKLMEQKCTTLRGKFALQVNSINDISDSAYTQLKKLNKTENENTDIVAADSTEFKSDWAPKPRRCLYLGMTDGVQQIFGLECVTIPALSMDLKPGVKIHVTGPVECRKAVLHLKPIHVKILGGDVESLVESNCMGQELNKRLHPEEYPPLPKVPPKPVYQRPPSPPRTNKSTFNPQDSKTQNIYSKVESTTFTDDDDPFVDGEDDLFMEIDENALLKDTQLATATTQPLRRPSTAHQPTFRAASAQLVTKAQQVIRAQQKSKIPPTIDLIDDDDDFVFSQVDMKKLTCDQPPSKRTKVVPKLPYQYIKVIKDNFDNLPNGQIVLVKACIATLVSGVKVENGQWTLSVCLNDGSGFLEAAIISKFLNRIIGFSYTEMKTMKMSSESNIKQKISNGLSGLSRTLIHMNGIFGIRIQSPIPMIVSFQEIESSHIAALKERLKVVE